MTNERSVLLFFMPQQRKIFISTLLAYGAQKSGNGLRGKENALIKVLVASRQGQFSTPIVT